MPPAVGNSTVIRPITTSSLLTIMGAFIVRASFWLPAFMGPSCGTALFVATGDYELPRARFSRFDVDVSLSDTPRRSERPLWVISGHAARLKVRLL
jgi:hypothetical protein